MNGWTFLVYRKLPRWGHTLVEELGIIWDQLWTGLQSSSVESVRTVQAVIHCCIGYKTTSFHNHRYHLWYFPPTHFFVFVKKNKQQSLECLMSNFLSNSASTSLQVNSTCVCDPCRKRNRRRQTPCVTVWFFLFFCAPQARSQMSSLPIWSSPTPQKEMCVSKSRRLHLADTACALTVASLMLGHP